MLADKLDLMSGLAAIVNHHEITHIAGTPTMLNLMDPGMTPTLEMVLLGGEAVTEATKAKWLPHVELWNTYGWVPARTIVHPHDISSVPMPPASLFPTSFHSATDPC